MKTWQGKVEIRLTLTDEQIKYNHSLGLFFIDPHQPTNAEIKNYFYSILADQLDQHLLDGADISISWTEETIID